MPGYMYLILVGDLKRGEGGGGERGFVDRTEKVHGHVYVGYDYRSRLVLPRLLIKYTSFWGES